MAETIWPAKPEMFVICPFTKKVCQHLLWGLKAILCICTNFKNSSLFLCALIIAPPVRPLPTIQILAQTPNGFHNANYEKSAKV